MKIEPEKYSSLINLRCGISIFPSQDKAFDQILSDLLNKAPARFILLTDISGQIISACGERGKADLVALGSLAAGDLAASQEIARISSGEYQENQMIMREGTKMHTIIYKTGPYLILLLQITSDVPLGWVRFLVKQAAVKINLVLTSDPEKVDDCVSEFKNSDLQEQVADLFNDLWKG